MVFTFMDIMLAGKATGTQSLPCHLVVSQSAVSHRPVRQSVISQTATLVFTFMDIMLAGRTTGSHSLPCTLVVSQSVRNAVGNGHVTVPVLLVVAAAFTGHVIFILYGLESRSTIIRTLVHAWRALASLLSTTQVRGVVVMAMMMVTMVMMMMMMVVVVVVMMVVPPMMMTTMMGAGGTPDDLVRHTAPVR
jgi:hypothetical protein